MSDQRLDIYSPLRQVVEEQGVVKGGLLAGLSFLPGVQLGQRGSRSDALMEIAYSTPGVGELLFFDEAYDLATKGENWQTRAFGAFALTGAALGVGSAGRWISSQALDARAAQKARLRAQAFGPAPAQLFDRVQQNNQPALLRDDALPTELDAPPSRLDAPELEGLVRDTPAPSEASQRAQAFEMSAEELSRLRFVFGVRRAREGESGLQRTELPVTRLPRLRGSGRDSLLPALFSVDGNVNKIDPIAAMRAWDGAGGQPLTRSGELTARQFKALSEDLTLQQRTAVAGAYHRVVGQQIEDWAHNASESEAGFTMKMLGGNASQGYAVAIAATEILDLPDPTTVGRAEFDRLLNEWFTENADFMQTNVATVGGFHWQTDAGVWETELNLSVVFQNLEAAKRFAVEQNQRGIGDLAAFARGDDGYVEVMSEAEQLRRREELPAPERRLPDVVELHPRSFGAYRPLMSDAGDEWKVSFAAGGKKVKSARDAGRLLVDGWNPERIVQELAADGEIDTGHALNVIHMALHEQPSEAAKSLSEGKFGSPLPSTREDALLSFDDLSAAQAEWLDTVMLVDQFDVALSEGMLVSSEPEFAAAKTLYESARSGKKLTKAKKDELAEFFVRWKGLVGGQLFDPSLLMHDPTRRLARVEFGARRVERDDLVDDVAAAADDDPLNVVPASAVVVGEWDDRIVIEGMALPRRDERVLGRADVWDTVRRFAAFDRVGAALSRVVTRDVAARLADRLADDGTNEAWDGLVSAARGEQVADGWADAQRRFRGELVEVAGFEAGRTALLYAGLASLTDAPSARSLEMAHRALGGITESGSASADDLRVLLRGLSASDAELEMVASLLRVLQSDADLSARLSGAGADGVGDDVAILLGAAGVPAEVSDWLRLVFGNGAADERLGGLVSGWVDADAAAGLLGWRESVSNLWSDAAVNEQLRIAQEMLVEALPNGEGDVPLSASDVAAVLGVLGREASEGDLEFPSPQQGVRFAGDAPPADGSAWVRSRPPLLLRSVSESEMYAFLSRASGVHGDIGSGGGGVYELSLSRYKAAELREAALSSEAALQQSELVKGELAGKANPVRLAADSLGESAALPNRVASVPLPGGDWVLAPRRHLPVEDVQAAVDLDGGVSYLPDSGSQPFDRSEQKEALIFGLAEEGDQGQAMQVLEGLAAEFGAHIQVSPKVESSGFVALLPDGSSKNVFEVQLRFDSSAELNRAVALLKGNTTRSQLNVHDFGYAQGGGDRSSALVSGPITTAAASIAARLYEGVRRYGSEGLIPFRHVDPEYVRSGWSDVGGLAEESGLSRQELIDAGVALEGDTRSQVTQRFWSEGHAMADSMSSGEWDLWREPPIPDGVDTASPDYKSTDLWKKYEKDLARYRQERESLLSLKADLQILAKALRGEVGLSRQTNIGTPIPQELNLGAALGMLSARSNTFKAVERNLPVNRWLSTEEQWSLVMLHDFLAHGLRSASISQGGEGMAEVTPFVFLRTKSWRAMSSTWLLATGTQQAGRANLLRRRTQMLNDGLLKTDDAGHLASSLKSGVDEDAIREVLRVESEGGYKRNVKHDGNPDVKNDVRPGDDRIFHLDLNGAVSGLGKNRAFSVKGVRRVVNPEPGLSKVSMRSETDGWTTGAVLVPPDGETQVQFVTDPGVARKIAAEGAPDQKTPFAGVFGKVGSFSSSKYLAHNLPSDVKRADYDFASGRFYDANSGREILAADQVILVGMPHSPYEKSGAFVPSVWYVGGAKLAELKVPPGLKVTEAYAGTRQASLPAEADVRATVGKAHGFATIGTDVGGVTPWLSNDVILPAVREPQAVNFGKSLSRGYRDEQNLDIAGSLSVDPETTGEFYKAEHYPLDKAGEEVGDAPLKKHRQSRRTGIYGYGEIATFRPGTKVPGIGLPEMAPLLGSAEGRRVFGGSDADVRRINREGTVLGAWQSEHPSLYVDIVSGSGVVPSYVVPQAQEWVADAAGATGKVIRPGRVQDVGSDPSLALVWKLWDDESALAGQSRREVEHLFDPRNGDTSWGGVVRVVNAHELAQDSGWVDPLKAVMADGSDVAAAVFRKDVAGRFEMSLHRAGDVDGDAPALLPGDVVLRRVGSGRDVGVWLGDRWDGKDADSLVGTNFAEVRALLTRMRVKQGVSGLDDFSHRPVGAPYARQAPQDAGEVELSKRLEAASVGGEPPKWASWAAESSGTGSSPLLLAAIYRRGEFDDAARAVRPVLALNPETPWPVLEAFVSGRHGREAQVNVASNPSVPIRVLEGFAWAVDPEVWMSLAANPATPRRTVEFLATRNTEAFSPGVESAEVVVPAQVGRRGEKVLPSEELLLALAEHPNATPAVAASVWYMPEMLDKWGAASLSEGVFSDAARLARERWVVSADRKDGGSLVSAIKGMRFDAQKRGAFEMLMLSADDDVARRFLKDSERASEGAGAWVREESRLAGVVQRMREELSASEGLPAEAEQFATVGAQNLLVGLGVKPDGSLLPEWARFASSARIRTEGVDAARQFRDSAGWKEHPRLAVEIWLELTEKLHAQRASVNPDSLSELYAVLDEVRFHLVVDGLLPERGADGSNQYWFDLAFDERPHLERFVSPVRPDTGVVGKWDGEFAEFADTNVDGGGEPRDAFGLRQLFAADEGEPALVSAGGVRDSGAVHDLLAGFNPADRRAREELGTLLSDAGLVAELLRYEWSPQAQLGVTRWLRAFSSADDAVWRHLAEGMRSEHPKDALGAAKVVWQAAVLNNEPFNLLAEEYPLLAGGAQVKGTALGEAVGEATRLFGEDIGWVEGTLFRRDQRVFGDMAADMLGAAYGSGLADFRATLRAATQAGLALGRPQGEVLGMMAAGMAPVPRDVFLGGLLDGLDVRRGRLRKFGEVVNAARVLLRTFSDDEPGDADWLWGFVERVVSDSDFGSLSGEAQVGVWWALTSRRDMPEGFFERHIVGSNGIVGARVPAGENPRSVLLGLPHRSGRYERWDGLAAWAEQVSRGGVPESQFWEMATNLLRERRRQFSVWGTSLKDNDSQLWDRVAPQILERSTEGSGISEEVLDLVRDHVEYFEMPHPSLVELAGLFGGA